jgi:hypothetical protein
MRYGQASGRRLAPVSDQVEVERSRRIRRMAVSAKAGFDAVQGDQGLFQPELGLDQRDAVQVGRIGRIRPGRRTPPARAPDHLEPRHVQRCDRRLQQSFGRWEIALQIRSERDDDDLIAMLGA